MMKIEKTETHHQFLRRDAGGYREVGDFLSDLKLDSGKLSDFIEDYLILVVLSTGCVPCKKAMETLLTYGNEHPSARILLLLETSEEKTEKIRDLFAESISILRVTEEFIKSNFAGVPWGMGLNAKGQILSSFPFQDREWFERIVSPVSSFVSASSKGAAHE